MNNTSTNSSKQRVDHVLAMLYRYRAVWIAPAVLGMLLSAFYVIFLRAETWSAKQSLIVRDDLLGQSFKPGRFDSLDSMKSAQETILEIARKPQVIRNALEQLGPKSKGMFGLGARGWPSEEVIEDVQGAISFSAPNGAEFGKTEVIVLTTKSSTRERSRQFIELLLNEIIAKVDDVRTLRLQSMETELNQVHQAALVAMNESQAKLEEMDRELGTDFGALSSLNDSMSSDNTIKLDMSQIHVEKRDTESSLETQRSLLRELVAARENPEQILSISGDLVKYQPALDGLKKELIKTQRDLAKMEGQYTPLHARVAHAKNEINAMKQQLYLELDASIVGMENQVSTTQQRLDRLRLELSGLDVRLLSLGAKRAGGLTQLTELKNRTKIANSAESDLAEIRGLAQSKNAALLTRVDEPQVSTRPDGLGKKAMILAATLGGLLLGLGVVLMIAPPMPSANGASTGGAASNDGTESLGQEFPQDATTDSFFDSKSFEKIVTRAAAAAAAASAAAIQSASKAKQFFANASNKSELESDVNPSEGYSQSFETSTRKADSLRHSMGFASEHDGQSATSHRNASESKAYSRQNDVTPGTPTVKDLLAAANAISKPAPIASSPISNSSLKSREQGKSAKIVAPGNQSTQKAPLSPPLSGPSAMAVAPKSTPNASLVAEKTRPESVPKPAVSESRKSESTVSMSLSTSQTIPAGDLAAIQLAALRGETVATKTESIAESMTIVDAEPKVFVPDGFDENVSTPTASPMAHELAEPVSNLDSPTGSESQANKTDSNKKPNIEIVQKPNTANPTPVVTSAGNDPQPVRAESALRPEPQTIVVSNVHDQVAKEMDEEVRMIGPLDASPVSELKRRGPNARPVDLAKSVDSDDSTFVRISLDEDSSAAGSSEPVGGNPFLKNRQSSGTTNNSEESAMPVPEQIKKLSDSIANFAKPIKKKDDTDQKF